MIKLLAIVAVCLLFYAYRSFMKFHNLNDKDFSAVIDEFISSDELKAWDKSDHMSFSCKVRALNKLAGLKYDHDVPILSRTDRCIDEVLNEMVPSLFLKD